MDMNKTNLIESLKNGKEDYKENCNIIYKSFSVTDNDSILDIIMKYDDMVKVYDKTNTHKHQEAVWDFQDKIQGFVNRFDYDELLNLFLTFEELSFLEDGKAKRNDFTRMKYFFNEQKEDNKLMVVMYIYATLKGTFENYRGMLESLKEEIEDMQVAKDLGYKNVEEYRNDKEECSEISEICGYSNDYEMVKATADFSKSLENDIA